MLILLPETSSGFRGINPWLADMENFLSGFRQMLLLGEGALLNLTFHRQHVQC